jgi:excisionase family DNA binding protein
MREGMSDPNVQADVTQEKLNAILNRLETLRPAASHPQRTLKAKEAAAWLGCSDKAVYKLFINGRLAGYKAPGIGVRIYAESVEEYKNKYANKKEPWRDSCAAVNQPKALPLNAKQFKPFRHLEL